MLLQMCVLSVRYTQPGFKLRIHSFIKPIKSHKAAIYTTSKDVYNTFFTLDKVLPTP